jgi:hypothetical protein
LEYIFPIYLLIGIGAVLIWFAVRWREVRRKRVGAVYVRVLSVMLGWPVYLVLAFSRAR